MTHSGYMGNVFTITQSVLFFYHYSWKSLFTVILVLESLEGWYPLSRATLMIMLLRTCVPIKPLGLIISCQGQRFWQSNEMQNEVRVKLPYKISWGIKFLSNIDRAIPRNLSMKECTTWHPKPVTSIQAPFRIQLKLFKQLQKKTNILYGWHKNRKIWAIHERIIVISYQTREQLQRITN